MELNIVAFFSAKVRLQGALSRSERRQYLSFVAIAFLLCLMAVEMVECFGGHEARPKWMVSVAPSIPKPRTFATRMHERVFTT